MRLIQKLESNAQHPGERVTTVTGGLGCLSWSRDSRSLTVKNCSPIGETGGEKENNQHYGSLFRHGLCLACIDIHLLVGRGDRANEEANRTGKLYG
jgi:hypothetical protein